MKTDWILYFGYGSLVNRDTRPSQEIAYSARLSGWRRVWGHRVSEQTRQTGCTSLSIEPLNDLSQVALFNSMQPLGGIDGVVVRLPVEELPQLDEREVGYERLSLPISAFDVQGSLDQESSETRVVVYRSQPENRQWASNEFPILQSYVDCVLAGYLRRSGKAGVRRFVDSTRGWNCPILNDRSTPLYPRWVSVSAEDQQFFDDCIRCDR